MSETEEQIAPTPAEALGVTPSTPSSAHPDRLFSFGEQLVGFSFNPSGDQEVYRVKVLFAQVLDAMQALVTKDDIRSSLANQAINEAVTAQMWAVKALTWK